MKPHWAQPQRKKEIMPTIDPWLLELRKNEKRRTSESLTLPPGDYRVIDGELFKVEPGQPCIDCVELRAELNHLRDELFDAREEGAADEAYMEKLLTKNVDLHNATVTLRGELDRMTAAAHCLQEPLDSGSEDFTEKFWAMKDYAVEIRAKYGFDKTEGVDHG